MSVTKKYRCRYYTVEGLPCKTPFLNVDVRNNKRQKDAGRGPPLAPQSDLFQRKKEDEDRRADRNRDRDKHRDSTRNRSASPPRPNPKKHAHKSDSKVESSVTAKVEDASYARDDFSSEKYKLGVELRAPPTQTTRDKEPAKLEGSDENKMAERLLGLFRSLANVSNEIVVATAAHEREGEKLRTYTEISSALSRISQAAATSVAPTLADIMLRHEQCKHRVDENFKALGGLWDEVFDVFCNEIARVLDSKLQDALGALENAGKRAWGEVHDERTPERSSHESKRRRISGSSVSPSAGQDEEVEQILAQMKMKIDEQAYSLQVLTKENTEVRLRGLHAKY
ncbi:hypothetical protein C8F01DRAFT_1132348 [Mycena amicta]|nr:hypothetical protein C8F01DRAFT_1132348 [Mycena amicta]